MAQRFDVTFKHLFRNSRGVLARMLFGDPGPQGVQWLNVEIPEIRNLRPDLLSRAPNGAIHHAEINANPDPNLAFRMLQYYVALVGLYHCEVVQTLLHIGREPLRIPSTYETPTLQFRFRIINLCELDGAGLLASEDWADNEFALLTQANREAVIRKVLAQLRTMQGQEQETAASTFVILGGILGIEDQLERRLKTEMIDLMENKVLGPAIRQGLEQGVRQGLEQGVRQGLEQGRHEEAARILRRLLHRRFGPLPPWAETKLATASQETLESWIDRVYDADSLERVLA